MSPQGSSPADGPGSAPPSASVVCAAAFTHELARAGVKRLFLCPGARSAPLAWTAERAGLVVTVHHDERSAAFVALGYARASGEVAAVCCTSGSALAQFAPAITEAWASGVPLLVLSADRPAHLHLRQAPQTMPQAGALDAWVVKSLALPTATMEPAVREHFARCAWLAVRAALQRGGPVHVNLPFTEPLVPSGSEEWPQAGHVAVSGAQETVADRGWEQSGGRSAGAVDSLAARISTRTLVCIGADAGDEAAVNELVAVCAQRGVPVLADALSGVRGPSTIHHYDILVRDAALAAALAPELVIRVGRTFTSKAFHTWLGGAAVDVPLWLWGSDTEEPAHRRVLWVDAGVAQLTATVLAGAPVQVARWAERWRRLNLAVATALRQSLDGTGPLQADDELRAMATVVGEVGDGEILHVASSMPVRHADLVVGAQPLAGRLTSNRGVNGIDGTVSTAVGLSLAQPPDARTWVVLGDVAMLHDMTGMLPARLLERRLTLVVLNNDGGGIFHFLPLADPEVRRRTGPGISPAVTAGQASGHEAPDPASAQRADTFERFFGTPHGLHFEGACQQFGFVYRRTSASDLAAVLAEVSDSPRVLVEVVSDRESGTADRRRLTQGLTEAARAALRNAGDVLDEA